MKVIKKRGNEKWRDIKWKHGEDKYEREELPKRMIAR